MPETLHVQPTTSRSEYRFGIPALAVFIGMVLPAVPIAIFTDIRYDPNTNQFVSVPVVGTLDTVVFLVSVGLAFGLVSWVLIERLDLDPLNYLMGTIVWPWVVVLGSVFLVFFLTGNTPWDHPIGRVYRILTGGGAIPYGATFMGGGLAAYLVTHLIERYQAELVSQFQDA